MPKNVVQTLRGADLNLQDTKLTGLKLMEQILKDVKATQTFAGVHLPDKLFITEEQFKSIESDTERLDETNDRIMITPLNVMEVHVVE